MYRLALLFTVFFALNATAKINNNSNDFDREESELEKILFVNTVDSSFNNFDINSIEIIELEEEVELGFNPKDYLPEGFNALKGMHDLDWNTIELVELEEEVELCFDTANYLPNDFNALKGKTDLGQHKIQFELIEIEYELLNNLTKKSTVQ